jgi:hypothetical protein
MECGCLRRPRCRCPTDLGRSSGSRSPGSSDPIVPYDEGRLGAIRGYANLPLAGALWSLERAARDWQAAEELAQSAGVTLDHPEQGRLILDEVRKIMAHDIEHHAADLTLIVSA